MNIINHQSNGAKGLRIAASICVILGWIALFIGFIGGCVAYGITFIAPFGLGVISLGAMYLTACVLRALASVAEVAQIYYNNNAPDLTEEYE